MWACICRTTTNEHVFSSSKVSAETCYTRSNRSPPGTLKRYTRVDRPNPSVHHVSQSCEDAYEIHTQAT